MIDPPSPAWRDRVGYFGAFVVRTVPENARTLKFKNQAFETEFRNWDT